MSAHTLTVVPANRETRKTKVTCTTCKLKGCVGRCQWKVVAQGAKNA